jgi:hypothetical protein
LLTGQFSSISSILVISRGKNSELTQTFRFWRQRTRQKTIKIAKLWPRFFFWFALAKEKDREFCRSSRLHRARFKFTVLNNSVGLDKMERGLGLNTEENVFEQKSLKLVCWSAFICILEKCHIYFSLILCPLILEQAIFASSTVLNLINAWFLSLINNT